MKILITGASGFLGRNLCEQLQGRYHLFSPSRKALNLLDAVDVENYLTSHSFDVVIHCATWNATRNSKKEISKVLENNLKMFFNLARASARYGKIIYYGSGSEFSRRYWMPKMGEDYFDRHVPEAQDGFSKYIMQKHTEKSSNIYNLRLFGVFGKYEDWEIRFISNAICKAVWDLPITIKQNVYFDYLFIDDLVRITEWFFHHSPVHHTYNICTGTTYDLRSLAEMVLAVSGKALPISVAREGLGREYSGDNSRAALETGALSFIPIKTAIEMLYAWYLTNKECIDREKLLIDK